MAVYSRMAYSLVHTRYKYQNTKLERGTVFSPPILLSCIFPPVAISSTVCFVRRYILYLPNVELVCAGTLPNKIHEAILFPYLSTPKRTFLADCFVYFIFIIPFSRLKLVVFVALSFLFLRFVAHVYCMCWVSILQWYFCIWLYSKHCKSTNFQEVKR